MLGWCPDLTGAEGQGVYYKRLPRWMDIKIELKRRVGHTKGKSILRRGVSMKKHLEGRNSMAFLKDWKLFNVVGTESANMRIMRHKLGRKVGAAHESHTWGTETWDRDHSVMVRYRA